MNINVNSVYFSATSNTKKVISRISKNIANNLGCEKINSFDFTLLKERNVKLIFDKNDIVLVGVPVYAGRVPNLLLKYLNEISADGSLCIPIVTFGNRNFDDALLELSDILDSNGFKVIGAGAFVASHSFSEILAKDRPDFLDIKLMDEFSNIIIDKVKLSRTDFDINSINGKIPYRDYFKPVDKNGNAFEFRKIKPHTFDSCIDCKICFNSCPMDAIEKNNPKIVSGKCIKCCSCIKKCPVGAKEFLDENFIKHKVELEELANIRVDSYICY